MSLLCDEYGSVYLVPGNRDRLGRGRNAKVVKFICGTMVEPGMTYHLAEGIKIASSPELADSDTILVQHSNIVYSGRFDRTAIISEKALLHITGHTHTGVQAGNYLNTGFLYRDSSNGAEPMMGGYFDVDIYGRTVNTDFHALGPVRRTRLKSSMFQGYVFAPYGRAFPVKLEQR